MPAFGILVRLWIWAALLRVLKHLVPLPKLVTLAGRSARKGADGGGEFEARLAEYLERRDRFPFRAPGNCLERSLGAYCLLCARGRRPSLVVGISLQRPGPEPRAQSPEPGEAESREPKAESPSVRGHVWVEVDGRPFGERAGELEGFTRVVMFDAEGNQRTVSGFSGALSAIRMG